VLCHHLKHRGNLGETVVDWLAHEARVWNGFVCYWLSFRREELTLLGG